MSIITIKPKEEDPKILFNQDKFKLTGKFIRKATNEREIEKILVTVTNDNPIDYGYNLESINFCEKIYNDIDLHVLEINLRVVIGIPQKTNTVSIKPNNLKINKGTIIYNSLHIYQIEETIENCKSDNWAPQPQTKKGNIIVGNP